MAAKAITWKIHLVSPPEKVYSFLSTAEGRSRFWAESAEERDGKIEFVFVNGQNYQGKIISAVPHSLFSIEYFDSMATFRLEGDGKQGTDLELLNSGVEETQYAEQHAGWVSVLLALKGAVDFGVDLRNHDPERSWDQLYVDN